MFGSRKSRSSPSPRQRAGERTAQRLAENPQVIQVPLAGAQVFYHPDFLDAAQCDRLVTLIDASRRPSTLLSDKGNDGFRTSESCDMDRWSPNVRPIDESIANLLGIDPANGETMQGQRYAPGQQFRAHHDWFHEDQSYWQKMKLCGGQRTWTAMIYLNEVEDGGATWFPQAGFRISPQRGLLLAWNNMNADGSPNDDTLHEGMPVVEGTKYIITKWFRETAWVS